MSEQLSKALLDNKERLNKAHTRIDDSRKFIKQCVQACNVDNLDEMITKRDEIMSKLMEKKRYF